MMRVGTSRAEKEEVRILLRIEALLERVVTQLEELNRKADEVGSGE